MAKKANESVVNFQPTSARIKTNSPNTLNHLQARSAWPSVVIGKLTGFESSKPQVDFPENPSAQPITALSGIVLSEKDIGCEIVLAFADGNPNQPIILSFLRSSQTEDSSNSEMEIQLDGKKLQFTAQQEIVLRCGDASITLTAAGKVMLKGTYVLSRSSGYNKIKGAAVDIN